MKKVNLCCLFMLTISLAFSQKIDTLYLWPGIVPGESEAKHQPVVTPNHEGNITRITNVTNPALLIYKPQRALNNGAGIIICPGGGHSILAIDLEGSEIASWLNKQGFTAFVLQYRVPKKIEGAMQDIQRAVRVVRQNSKTWGINPDKIGVMGFSAGGGLCARLSSSYRTRLYDAIDEQDSISCRPSYTLLIYSGGLASVNNQGLPSEYSVDQDTPPIIFAGPETSNSTTMAA